MSEDNIPIEQLEPIQGTEDTALKRSPGTNNAESANRDDIGIYVDFRSVNIYRFLKELEGESGGFSGETGAGATCYIVPNKTEPYYYTRVKRAVLINDYKKILKAKYSDIFTLREIQTTVSDSSGNIKADHGYLDYAKNITGSGMSSVQLTESILNSSYRDAVGFIIGDSIEGSQPYCYMRGAIDVSRDKDGDYLIEVNEQGAMIGITFDEKSTRGSDNKEVLHRRYYGLEVFKELESTDNGDTWVVVGEPVLNQLRLDGEPFLPVKPIISQSREKPSDYMPKPDSYSMAKIVLGIFDRSSMLDYVIDKQGHSLAVINGSAPSFPNGLFNAMIIPETDQKLFQPFMLSPDYHFPDIHSKRIAELYVSLLNLAEDNGVTASQNSTATESGLSKSFTYSAKSVQSKKSLRLALECHEFYQTVYRVFTGDNTEFIVTETFPEDFTPKVETSLQDLDGAIELFGDLNLIENKKKALRAYVEKLYPNETSDRMQELYEEIKNATFGAPSDNE